MGRLYVRKEPLWKTVVEAPWSGDELEVAQISLETGRLQIDVRRAIMKVGPDRKKVIAALTGGTV